MFCFVFSSALSLSGVKPPDVAGNEEAGRGKHGSVVETLHLEESHRMAEMPQDYFQMGIFLISRKEFEVPAAGNEVNGSATFSCNIERSKPVHERDIHRQATLFLYGSAYWSVR